MFSNTQGQVPGYQGYVPGVKSENQFGSSYGKTSAAATVQRANNGFDMSNQDRFVTQSAQAYQNQMLLSKRIVEKHAPEQPKPTIDDVPSHVKAKFYGMANHEQDRYTNNQQLEEAATQFYGDGTLLQEMYARNQETINQAAAKFHGEDGSASLARNDQITMSYAEAREAARQ